MKRIVWLLGGFVLELLERRRERRRAERAEKRRDAEPTVRERRKSGHQVDDAEEPR